jgi:small-conductance mechanosensitive channel
LLLGLGMLAALYKFGGGLTDGTLAVMLREALLLLLMIGFSKILLTFIFQTLFRRSDIPRILPDILFVLSLAVYVLFRMHAFGVNPTSLAVSAGTVVAGTAYALKDTLGNLMGGIAVQLDNSCRVGDWVRIENVTGQIVDIRWRYLAVATNSGETVIVPGSVAAKGSLVVLARRGDQRISWRREIDFAVSYATAPSRVITAVETALMRAEMMNVATSPALRVTCRGFGDNAILYTVLYWLVDLRQDLQTDSQVRVHVHAALTREGMEIPLPHRILIDGGVTQTGATQRTLAERVATVGKLELFAPLTEDERRAMTTELADCMYVRNDTISRRGEAADAMFVLARGTVAIYGDADPTSGQARPRLATLAAPNYFGEMGLLTGQARAATVVAESDVLCYRLDKSGFDAILRARPELADGLSKVVAERQAANDATLQAADADARARMAMNRASDLVRKIRQFFDIAP